MTKNLPKLKHVSINKTKSGTWTASILFFGIKDYVGTFKTFEKAYNESQFVLIGYIKNFKLELLDEKN